MTSEVPNSMLIFLKHRPHIQIIVLYVWHWLDIDNFYAQEVHRIVRGIKMDLLSSIDLSMNTRVTVQWPSLGNMPGFKME